MKQNKLFFLILSAIFIFYLSLNIFADALECTFNADCPKGYFCDKEGRCKEEDKGLTVRFQLYSSPTPSSSPSSSPSPTPNCCVCIYRSPYTSAECNDWCKETCPHSTCTVQSSTVLPRCPNGLPPSTIGHTGHGGYEFKTIAQTCLMQLLQCKGGTQICFYTDGCTTIPTNLNCPRGSEVYICGSYTLRSASTACYLFGWGSTKNYCPGWQLICTDSSGKQTVHFTYPSCASVNGKQCPVDGGTCPCDSDGDPATKEKDCTCVDVIDPYIGIDLGEWDCSK